MTGTIHEYLGQFTGKDVLFFTSPGEARNSVMAAATYQALNRARARYRTPRTRRFDPAGQFILYGGGGLLQGGDRDACRLLQRLHRTAKHLTILPHTIKDVEDVLGEFGSNVTVIAREPTTFEYISGLPRRYETLLMDDVAFSLDLDRLREDEDRADTASALADVLVASLLHSSARAGFADLRRFLSPGALVTELRARPHGGVLNCFRLDDDAAGIEIPSDNIDLPAQLMFGVSPAPVAFRAARAMLDVLSRFDEIRTDRLHVAIAAGLLGKPTRFFPNTHFKGRAVYEFSMKERFPNVTWMG
jgi:hypothetical protein